MIGHSGSSASPSLLKANVSRASSIMIYENGQYTQKPPEELVYPFEQV